MFNIRNIFQYFSYKIPEKVLVSYNLFFSNNNVQFFFIKDQMYVKNLSLFKRNYINKRCNKMILSLLSKCYLKEII